MGAPVLSPDGKTAVFAVTEWSIAKSKSTSSLWLVDVAGGEPRRLTQAPGGSDGAPAWSPDGKRIAFVSKRADDDAAALYVIAIGGGEARRVASVPYGFRAPKWLSNTRIAALTQVITELAGKLEKSDLEAMRKEMKRRKDSPMTAKVTDERQYRFWDKTLAEGVSDKLVAVDAESGALTDLSPGWNRVFSTVMDPGFDVSADGKWIAMAINATPPPYRERTNLDIYVIPTDGTGALKDLTASNPYTDDSPALRSRRPVDLLRARGEVHRGQPADRAGRRLLRRERDAHRAPTTARSTPSPSRATERRSSRPPRTAGSSVSSGSPRTGRASRASTPRAPPAGSRRGAARSCS